MRTGILVISLSLSLCLSLFVSLSLSLTFSRSLAPLYSDAYSSSSYVFKQKVTVVDEETQPISAEVVQADVTLSELPPRDVLPRRSRPVLPRESVSVTFQRMRAIRLAQAPRRLPPLEGAKFHWPPTG